MTLKVYMKPKLSDLGEGGIKRVIEAYTTHLPQFDIEFVDQKDAADLTVIHAGTSTDPNIDVAACHGLYWTADYDASPDEYKTNARVIDNLRRAKEVIVPSQWVAHNIARDLRFLPHVIPHGIEWRAWQHKEDNLHYVLYNKNRIGDVCSPETVQALASRCPEINFVSTFAVPNIGTPSNMRITGVVPHTQMARIVQRCGVYLSVSPETFGIGTLEAMAAGKPILGWRSKGNLDLVKHQVNGYLAEPGNMDDLLNGLYFCLNYEGVLGANGREMARGYTWQETCRRVAEVLCMAKEKNDASDQAVSGIIPCHNYQGSVGRAIESILGQVRPVQEVIVVVDNSTDDSLIVAQQYANNFPQVKVAEVKYGNVARTRNHGIELASSPYVFCLDADDAITPDFTAKLLPVLQQDNSLGIAYSRLYYVTPEGNEGLSQWPSEWDYDKQLETQNQIPTCCLFRKEMWKRLGGYSPYCCPKGAGFEDAEYWLRAGAFGWKAQLVDEPLFIYSFGSGRVSGQTPEEKYQDLLDEGDYYRIWAPWYTDQQHPFGSYATPAYFSHPVRQYDEPLVSVIVPVGPNHEEAVWQALRSVEAQTVRQWELIVCWDTEQPLPERLTAAYPFATFLTTGHRGAGYARNRGAEVAKGKLLCFLDADDWLYPDFLAKCLPVWEETGQAVYTDYVGKALISDPVSISHLQQQGRLKDWDGTEAVTNHHALAFDCEKALSEPRPNRDFYVWCNVTTIHPKAWWAEVGGFDEDMPSWEDWDYHLRLVHRGHYFHHLEEQLMVYRLYTGNRRDEAHRQLPDGSGRHIYDLLIEYLQSKYALEEARGGIVGCSGCGQKSVNQSQASQAAAWLQAEAESVSTVVNNNGQKLIEYRHTNSGDHWVPSPSGLASRNGQAGYGMHVPGDRFLAYEADIALMPMNFVEVPVRQSVMAPARAEVRIAPEAMPVAQPVPQPLPQVAQNMPALTEQQEINRGMADLAAGMERARQEMMKQYGLPVATPVPEEDLPESLPEPPPDPPKKKTWSRRPKAKVNA